MSNWWYFAIFVATTGIALGTTYAAKSGLPWWALFVALLFAWLFVPIIGTVRSIPLLVDHAAEMTPFS